MFFTNHEPADTFGRTDDHSGDLYLLLYLFRSMHKNYPRWPQMGPGGFFPTNPHLADILGDMDFDFEIFDFWDFFGS